MDFHIRAPSPDEAPALVALRTALFGESSNMLFEPDEWAAMAEAETERLRIHLAQAHPGIWVAVVGSTLVGFVGLMRSPRRRLAHSAVLAIGVLAAHQGQGVATALMQAAINGSHEVGLMRVELTVRVDNLRAIALYERMGFELEGCRRQSLLVNGICVDEFTMARIHTGESGPISS